MKFSEEGANKPARLPASLDAPRPPASLDAPRAPNSLAAPRPPTSLDAPRPPASLAAPRPPASLDEVLSQFNIFGRYHLTVTALIFVAYMTNAIYCTNYIFVVEKIDYRCKHSHLSCDVGLDNSSFNPQCYERVARNNAASCAVENGSVVVPCREWSYEKPDSFVGEFNLACEEWRRTFVGTAHCIGYMVGLLIVGPMSDRLGRKTTMIVTAVTGGILGIARSFTTQYFLYVALEFLESALGDSCSPAFMLMIEIVSTKDRAKFFVINNLGYVAGSMAFSWAAWYFTYWRTLLQVIYTPALLMVLYIFWMDESPRWLLTKGRRREAIKILEKAATVNKIHLDKATLESLTVEDNSESDLRLITLLKTTFKSRILMQRFLVCVVWWTTSTLVSYGSTVNAVLLAGNKYMNFFLMSVVDIPMIFLMGYMLIYCKRRMPLFYSFLMSAIFFGVHPFLPKDMPWLSLCCYIAGKSMVTIFFNFTYVFTSELFPTYTRNTMHALCSSIGRIGSISAMQTPLLLQYWHGLPSIVFAGMSLLAALVTLSVPDTADGDLPNTVVEAEVIGAYDSEKVEKTKAGL